MAKKVLLNQVLLFCFNIFGVVGRIFSSKVTRCWRSQFLCFVSKKLGCIEVKKQSSMVRLDSFLKLLVSTPLDGVNQVRGDQRVVDACRPADVRMRFRQMRIPLKQDVDKAMVGSDPCHARTLRHWFVEISNENDGFFASFADAHKFVKITMKELAWFCLSCSFLAKKTFLLMIGSGACDVGWSNTNLVGRDHSD